MIEPTSPCQRTHRYQIFYAARGTNSIVYDNAPRARARYNMVGDESEPVWVALHDDDTTCSAEANYQETLAVDLRREWNEAGDGLHSGGPHRRNPFDVIADALDSIADTLRSIDAKTQPVFVQPPMVAPTDGEDVVRIDTSRDAVREAVDAIRATNRRATVADVLFVLPHGGAHERPRILDDEVRRMLERRQLTDVEGALADAVRHGLVGIEPVGAMMWTWITDAGLTFEDERLRGWDRAMCPLAHEYDMFTPGLGASTGRTGAVDTLFTGMRAFPGSSIFAYHHDDAGYCKVESDRVNALALTPQSAEPERITAFVVIDEDGIRVRTPQQFTDDLVHYHYGDGDRDPNEVVMVHLRGEYELRRALFSSGGDPETDERDYIHYITFVGVADGPHAGKTVGRLSYTIDGRA